MPLNLSRKSARAAAAVFAAAAAVALCAVDSSAAPLDPSVFTSLGTLNITSGSITIDTDAVAIAGAANFNGSLYYPDGTSPPIALFTFGNVTLGAGVTINVTGSRPLALLSQGSMSIASGINLSGGAGGVPAGGTAGPAGGYAGGAAGVNGTAGAGPGGGPGGITATGGGGGAYGGNGAGDAFGTPGGASYGDLFTLLIGGSGGGGGGWPSNAGGGGGGAGVIELGATRDLSLTSSLIANGGGVAGAADYAGGAGAGGGILLHASSISVATLQATGGSGPDAAGGGGRLTLAGENLNVPQILSEIASLSPSVYGGTGFQSGKAGVLTLRPALATVQATQSLNVGVTPGQTGRTDARVELLPKSLTVQSGGNATIISSVTWGSGGVVSLTGGSLNIAENTTFAAGSTFNWSSGSLSIASGRTLRIDGGVASISAGAGGLPNGATLRVSSAGQFNTGSNLFDVGSSADPGNGPTGTLLVDGNGSQFRSGAGSRWGSNAGDFATVTFSNLGAGTIETLLIATNGGQARVNLFGGSALNVRGLNVGSTTAGSSATINLEGGALNVYDSAGSANFRQGTQVNLSGGTLSLASNATFAAGSQLNLDYGSVIISNGKTLTFDGGTGSIGIGGGGLSDGATLRVTNGGHFFLQSFFDIGSTAVPGTGPTGTLVVDGPGSQMVQTAGGGPFWGPNIGDFATVSFSNQAVGTLLALAVAETGGQALVNLQSGAVLNVGSIGVGNTNAGSSATINIAGGALNVYSSTGQASFRQGATVNLSDGTLNLAGNGTFSRSNVNWTGGTLIIGSGKTLAISGGTATLTNVSAGLSGGATLRILNGGRFTSNSYFDIGSSALPNAGPTGTLEVDGAGSQFSLAGTSYWGYNVNDFATVTISNHAVASFSGLTIGASGGRALVTVSGGAALNVEAPLVGGVSSGGATTINISGGALNIALGATLRNGAVVNYSSGTFADAGTLAMQADSKLLLSAGGDKVVRSGVVNMSGTSRIDLADNDMVVDYTGPSQLTAIKGYLIAGRNGGSWTGNSLTSSAAATDPVHGSLGYGEASDVLGASGGTFAGVPVDGTAVLIKFTYPGDANLDGVVDLKDLYRLAVNYNAGGKLWTSGDFNYDGLTNVQDLTALAINWQAGVAAPLANDSLSTALAAFGLPPVSVPEPTFAVLFTLAGLTARVARRQRSR
jgi:hypothetical protein